MSKASPEIPLILEKIEPECSDVAVNTSTKIDPPNSGLKILSRYLRASTGSCHDICKYGTDVTPKRAGSGPIPKLLTSMRTDGQNLEVAVSAVRKLKFGLSSKPFSDSETQTPKNLDVGKRKVSMSTNKELKCPKTISFDPEGIDVSLELKHNQLQHSSLSRQGSNYRRNCETIKTSKAANEFRSKETRTSLGGQRKALVTPTVSLPPKHSLRRISSMPALSPKNLKRLSLPSQEKIKTAEPNNLSGEDVPQKTLYKIGPVVENRTLEPTQNHVDVTNLSSSSCLALDNKYPKYVKKRTSTTGLPSSSKKNLRTTRSGTHDLQPSLSSLSHRQKELGQRRCGTHSKQLSLSSLSLSSSSMIQYGNKHNKESHSASDHDTKVSHGTSDFDNKENEKQKVNLKAELKRRARRAGKVGLENSPGKKLKFRKGKVVELQPEDGNPRRLKFTPTVSLPPKHSLRRISSMPTLSPKNLKRLSLPSEEKVKTLEPHDLDDEDVPEKSLYKIGPVAENRTLELTQNHVHVTSLSSSLCLRSDRKYLKRLQKRTSTAGSPSYFEKNLRTTQAGTHALQSSHSSLSSRKKERGYTRNGTHSKQVSLSSLSLSSSSITQSRKKYSKENHSASDTDTKENHTKENEKHEVNLEVGQKSRVRRAGIVSSPVKRMKFRKGKIVDLQPEDSNLKRLKFRQAKLLPEIQIDNAGMRKVSYKRNEVDSELNDVKSLEGNGKRSFRKNKVIEELFGTRINSKEVVLRHHNVVRRNNSQSLFNNVIEETASRLVRTRKSKVKALVGAFETVISLQDTRPSAMAGAC
nr:uncharacterized protein LOC112491548 [Ziziphus jujuba var. spinosa]XP_048328876.1 uncharacterized protein LOC112491548 [Ziziphus jujuba var. spinosa]